MSANSAMVEMKYKIEALKEMKNAIYKQWVKWNLIASNKWDKSVMETSGEMKWKVKAISEIILWRAVMKGIVVKCIMNEKYDEGKKWNEIWYGGNRWKIKMVWKYELICAQK